MKINKDDKLMIDGEYVPNSVKYKIVNQFFLLAQKQGEVYLPCLQTWQYYSGDFTKFELYAYIARRYGFSTLKRRGEKWYENGKLIINDNQLINNEI